MPTPALEERGNDSQTLGTVCGSLDDARSPSPHPSPCLGSELGLVSTVPLQPSCAPATPHTRLVWQPVSPPRRARMGCWAHWTQSSARSWARAASALRVPSCTGATQHSASLRRSVVGSSCPEAHRHPSKSAVGWSVSQGGPSLGQSGPSPPLLSPLCPSLPPTAACTDSTGVPRALGETWNSSLSGCCQHQCQAQDTIVPVDVDCPTPRPESCLRFGEVLLLVPTEDPCCLGAVCGESHCLLPRTSTVRWFKGSSSDLDGSDKAWGNESVFGGRGVAEGTGEPCLGGRGHALGVSVGRA